MSRPTEHSVAFHPFLSDAVRTKLNERSMQIGLRESGFADWREYHGSGDESFARVRPVGAKHVEVDRGGASRAYAHHQMISSWRDGFCVLWSAGTRDEDAPGQRIYSSVSGDGVAWSEARPAALPGELYDAEDAFLLSGLLPWGESLLAFVSAWRRSEGEELRMALYETGDLHTWRPVRAYEPGFVLRESPRRTGSGAYLAAGFDLADPTTAVVFRWPAGTDIRQDPERVEIPFDAAVLRPESGSWFERPDGTIVMLCRDGMLSLRLCMTVSRNDGRSWDALGLTGIPNSYSRTAAGNLPDGRMYLIGNHVSHFMDRRELLMLTGAADGRFDRLYAVRSGPPERRFSGLHKDIGFAYPSALVKNGRLLVAYSVNKEDVAVSMFEAAQLQP